MDFHGKYSFEWVYNKPSLVKETDRLYPDGTKFETRIEESVYDGIFIVTDSPAFPADEKVIWVRNCGIDARARRVAIGTSEYRREKTSGKNTTAIIDNRPLLNQQIDYERFARFTAGHLAPNIEEHQFVFQNSVNYYIKHKLVYVYNEPIECFNLDGTFYKPIQVSITTSEATQGNSDGEILIEVLNQADEHSYYYSIDGGLNDDSQNNKTGLSSGTYDVVVRSVNDSNGVNGKTSITQVTI